MGGPGNLLKNRILDIVCLFFGRPHERIVCPELFSMKMKMASFFDSANICVLLGLLTPIVGHTPQNQDIGPQSAFFGNS